MSKLNHYLSMIMFMAAVMLGVQVPNFVDQYVKRVDAHLVEVETNFSKYQEAADEFHDGSIEALIDLYDSENNPSFQWGAEAIRNSHQRLQRFRLERSSLQAGFWQQLKFVALHGDRELISDTQRNYSPNVPLNANAAICGLGAGVLAAMLYELLLLLIKLPFRRRYRPIPQTRQRHTH
ncbi:DUF2937 family protein [bacterium SCSIO 12696]|nr:DUF2937 family protein [bacterium SCSIO 12696]